MDNGKLTALTLLDLSAAFDTIDHDILLQRLHRYFGISTQPFWGVVRICQTDTNDLTYRSFLLLWCYLSTGILRKDSAGIYSFLWSFLNQPLIRKYMLMLISLCCSATGCSSRILPLAALVALWLQSPVWIPLLYVGLSRGPHCTFCLFAYVFIQLFSGWASVYDQLVVWCKVMHTLTYWSDLLYLVSLHTWSTLS